MRQRESVTELVPTDPLRCLFGVLALFLAIALNALELKYFSYHRSGASHSSELICKTHKRIANYADCAAFLRHCRIVDAELSLVVACCAVTRGDSARLSRLLGLQVMILGSWPGKPDTALTAGHRGVD